MPKNLKKPIAKAIFGFGTDLQIHFGFFEAKGSVACCCIFKILLLSNLVAGEICYVGLVLGGRVGPKSGCMSGAGG